MADSQLRIVITATNDAKRVVDEVVRTLSGVSQQLGLLNGVGTQAGRGIKQASDSARDGKKDFADLASAAAATERGISALTSGVKFLVGGFLALKTVQMVKDFADTAARAQVLGTVLNIVGQNAGISRQKLADIDNQIQKLNITAIASRESLAKFIQAGLRLEDAPKLARAAQDLAVIAGQNSSETFRRLIVNIQQMDVVGLRFQGLIVSRNQAEIEYAKSVGKTTDQLNIFERRQAFANAVLAEGSKLAGSYEASMTNVGKQLTSLDRLIEQNKLNLGNNLLPAYSAIVQELTIFLENVDLVTKGMSDQSDGAKRLGEAVRSIIVPIREVAEFIVLNIDKVAAFIGIIAALKFTSVVTEFGVITKSIGDLTTAIAGLPGVFGKVAGSLSLLRAAVLGVFGAAFIGVTIGNFLNQFQVVQDVAAIVVSSIIGGFQQMSLAVGLAFTAIKFVAQLAWNSLTGGGEEAARKIRENFSKEVDRTRQEIARIQQLIKDTPTGVDKGDAIKKTSQDLIDVNAKLFAAKQRQAEMILAGNQASAKALETDIKQLTTSKDVLTAKLRQQQAEAGISVEAQKTISAEIQKRTEAAATAVKIKQDLDAIFTAEKELFDEKFDFTEPGKVFSKDNQSAVAAFTTLFDAFSRQVKTATGQTVVNTSEIRAAIIRMVDSAKTVDDFTRVLRTLGDTTKVSQALIDQLSRTTLFNRQKAEAAELDKILEGFNARMKELADLQKLIGDVSNSAIEDRLKLERVQAEVSNNREAVARTEIRAIQETARFATQRYFAELQAIRITEIERTRLITERVTDERERNRQITDENARSNQQRLQTARDYYGELRRLNNEALDNYKRYASEVRSLDERIRQEQQDGATAIRELNRQLLTPQQAYFDRKRELAETDARVQQAIADRNFEEAQRGISRFKELTQEIQNDPAQQSRQQAIQEAIQNTNRGTQLQTELLKTQKAEAQQAADANRNLYATLSQQLSAVGQQIVALSQQQLLRLHMEIDAGSLTAAVQQVINTFSQLVIRVPVIADTQTSGSGFATGGKIVGPGTETSDSILAMVSAGEYVMRGAAVRHYGEAFMSAINSLSLPKFAVGGSVGRAVTAAGGDTPLDRMALDLSISHQPVGTLRGSRSTVQALAKALQHVKKGGGR